MHKSVQLFGYPLYPSTVIFNTSRKYTNKNKNNTILIIRAKKRAKLIAYAHNKR